MKLTFLERLMVLSNLPAEGDILFLRMRQELISKVGLSEQEIAEYEFKQDPSTHVATWRNDLPQEFEIPLTDAETGVIRDALTRLNREHKLTPNHLSLYEKFVEKGA